MTGLLGCDLCQREGVEAVGISPLGLHHYETCADCRRIIVAARKRIAGLTEPVLGEHCANCGKGDGIIECKDRNGERYLSCLFCVRRQPSLMIWARDGDWEFLKFCPGCGRNDIGLGSCDGRPGCAYCLRELREGEIRAVRPPCCEFDEAPSR